MSEKQELKIPPFENEAEEADWWFQNKGAVEDKLITAMRTGTALTGSAQRLTTEARGSKGITIRMPLADLERARLLSARKGLAYQTFIKILLHEALDAEEKRIRA